MFYTYRQNNSGGGFYKPAIMVVIEAGSAEEANELAENNGLYFNGCDDGRDCDCCGDRWYPVSENDGEAVPSRYGEPLVLEGKYKPDGLGINWGESSGIPNIVVFYQDGSRKEVW